MTNAPAARLTEPAPPSRFDDRGLPTGELIWHPRDEDDPGELTRFAPEHVVALGANVFHHTTTGMLYVEAAAGHHPVAEVFDEQLGHYRRLRLPPPNQAKTIDEWNQREETARLEATVADEQRRRRLRADRRPVTLGLVTNKALPTLGEAHAYLAAREALIEVRDGGLHVEIAPNAGTTPGLPPAYGATELANALQVLYAAERVVVDHLANGFDLPDADIDPNGRIIT